MHAVVGPVITRKGGYAFDWWTPEAGLSRSYSYSRVEDAHYARKVEIRYRRRSAVICCTLDEFASVLAARQFSVEVSAHHRC